MMKDGVELDVELLLPVEPGLQDGVLEVLVGEAGVDLPPAPRPPSCASCFSACDRVVWPAPSLLCWAKNTSTNCGWRSGPAQCAITAALSAHLVEREVAQHQPHLAGVDVALLELGQGVVVEGGAVRAGQRAVLDDRDRRRRIADRRLAEIGGAAPVAGDAQSSAGRRPAAGAGTAGASAERPPASRFETAGCYRVAALAGQA